jgi:excisionase family DNA binding protein
MHDRLTVAEAAQRLGISKEAVRKRIVRGTLRAEKDADGTVWVYFPPSNTSGGAQGDIIATLRRQIEDFREQLADANTANRENRRIIAALTQRIPQLEYPQESQGKGTTVRAQADNAPESASTHSPTSGFLPPLKDRLPLREYVLAVTVPLAWVAFVGTLTILIYEVGGSGSVAKTGVFLLRLVPSHVLLLLSGFWLGMRRRGGLSRTTLGIIGVPLAVCYTILDSLVEAWYFRDPSYLDSFLDYVLRIESILEGVAASLLVVGGALLGKAAQRRGLKTGIYGDDPAASADDLQSGRSVLNLVVGGGAATVIAALINAISDVVTN